MDCFILTSQSGHHILIGFICLDIPSRHHRYANMVGFFRHSTIQMASYYAILLLTLLYARIFGRREEMINKLIKYI